MTAFKTMAAVVVIAAAAASVPAQNTTAQNTTAQTQTATAQTQNTATGTTQTAVQVAPNAAAQTAQSKQRMIVVSLEDRKLALLEDGQVKKVYTVAVGKPSTPSPEGTFTIERRVMNPAYHHEGKTVQPGPGNPVGSRWMGLSIRGYGIHGTNVPSSIGKAASHGCIRMGKADIEELFGLVQEGDTVELVGKRNDETAQLFGTGDKPVVAAGQQAIVAQNTQEAPVVKTEVVPAAAER